MIGSSDGTQYEDHFDRMINNPIPQEPETPKESGTKVAANVVKGNLSQMDVQIEADPVMLRVSNPPDRMPPGNDRMPAGAIKGSDPVLGSQFEKPNQQTAQNFDNFDKVPGKGNSGDRYSTKGFNVGGDPYERWDANQGTRFDHFQMLNKLVNNKAFQAWVNALPENTDGNVEDRRLTDKTLQGYKQLVKDADDMGLSQDVRDHAFIERRGQFGGVHGNVGAPLPTPDPRRSGGGDLSAATRDKIISSAKPVRMMDEDLRKGKVTPQLADQVGGPGKTESSSVRTYAPNNNNASYTWTQKDHETFLKMKADGASNAEIAKELGKTRNAVIGRTNRLGLSDPNDPRAVGRKVNQQREEGITPEETPRNKPSLPRLKFLERPEIPE